MTQNIDQADNINQTIGSLVFSKAATTKAESLEIYESKQRGSGEDHTTIVEIHNTSSATTEGIEENVLMRS